MFDWNDLRHFLAVARSGSTLAAAKVLGVSQPTVHRRLDELEKRLGCQLVTRSPAGYKLTELGEKMLAHALGVEEAIQSFERCLASSKKELVGTIKLTCPEEVGIRLVKSFLLEKFQARFPGLRVELVISDNLLDLTKGEADIAIRGAETHGKALFGRKIADSPWALYGSRQYLKRNGRVEDLADINRHAIALFDVELKQHVTNQWLQSVAPNARIATRCNSLAALALAAKSGVGLAVLPVTVGEANGNLVQVIDPIPELTTHFYLLIHEDMKRTPRVRALFDFIIEEIGDVRAILGDKKLASQ